jgi:hypothetical protein
VAPAIRSGGVLVGLGLEGYLSVMADPDPNNPNLFQRAKQAQSKALREQVARSAEAVAETEQEVARVHRTLAEQGGPLAEEAGERADRAEQVAAKERAEAERCAGLNRAEPG